MSSTMMNFTEMAELEASNVPGNAEDEFITPHIMDDFDSQTLPVKEEMSNGLSWSDATLTAQIHRIKKEGSQAEDALLTPSSPHQPLSCKVKTEPASENEQVDCEQKNTLDIVIKQESIEVDDYLMEDEVKTDEDSGAEASDDALLKSENDGNMSGSEYDTDISEQESISGSGRMDRKKQILQDQYHIDETGQTCSECGKVFDSSQSCLQHMWLTHTGEKGYKCKLCGKTFKYMSRLQHHKVSHSNKRPHSCNLCEKTYKFKGALQQHIAACHSNERPLSCELCDRTFKLKDSLKKHKILCHSNERPHSCDVCDRTFDQKSDLWTHKEMCHLDERPHSCDVCSKTFKRKDHLQKHKTVSHSNERPYSCDLCEKAFKQKGHLQRHKETCHSNERPHSCDVCEKTFKQKAHLWQHKLLCHSNQRR